MVNTDVEQLRARYVATLDMIERASDRTIAALEAARKMREVGREVMQQGRPLVNLERVMEPQPLRAELSNALAELERTRHESQRLLFQILHAEGRTLAEIGRAYGISRQLVSRLVNEPDPEPVDGP
jgi:hypothetical protein